MRISGLVCICVHMCMSDSDLLVCVCVCLCLSVCGPVNPCCSTVSVPLPLRVNIGLTTCNDILSYACLTPKEPHPVSPHLVCVCVWLPFTFSSLYLLLSFLNHSASFSLPRTRPLSPSSSSFLLLPSLTHSSLFIYLFSLL